MSELEPIEPTSIRHVLDVGLSKHGGGEFAYNHIDYRFGDEPTAIWARAYVETINKAAVHNLDAHDANSDHVLRALMYLAARFTHLEVFDADSESGYHPLPSALDKKVRDLVAAYFDARRVKVAGWDEPEHSYKA